MVNKKLNIRQERFCKLYASKKEFFGNGVKSYMEVYNCSNYLVAKTNASRLLTNANLLDRISELLNDLVLNDAFVDKQLGFLITQLADGHLTLKAIQEYNRLRQRISKKVKLSGEVEQPLPQEDRDRLDVILEMNR